MPRYSFCSRKPAGPDRNVRVLRLAGGRRHARPRDHHHDAPNRPVEARSVEHHPNLVGGRIGVVQNAPGPDVHVDNDVVVRRERRRHLPDGVEGLAQRLLARVGDDDLDAPALVRVLAQHEAPVADLDVGEGAEPADAVEAPCQHLEHHLAHGGRGLLEAGREQFLERLRAFDQRGHPRTTIRAERISREGRQVRLHRGVHRPPQVLETRAIERPVVHVPRHVADGGMALSRPGDQLVDQCSEAWRLSAVSAQQALLENGHHGVHLLVDTAVGLEHPQETLAQRGRRRQRIHAVVRERALELFDEDTRQLRAARVDRPQIGEEILFGAERATLVVALGRRMARKHRGHVREDGEDFILGAPAIGVGIVKGLARPHVLAHEPLRLGRIDVEAEHQASKALQQDRGAKARAALQLADPRPHALENGPGAGDPPFGLRPQGDSAEGHSGPGGESGLLGERVDVDQRRAGADLGVRRDHHLANDAAKRGGDGQLHLHRFEHRQAGSRRHLGARRDVDRDHHRRAWRPHDAGVGARDPVRYALDLDQVRVPLRKREHAVAVIAVGDPPLARADLLDLEVDRRAAHVDPVLLEALALDAELIAVSQVSDLHLASNVRPARGPHPGRRGEELLELGIRLGVVDVDGRLQQGNAGMLAGFGRRDRAHPVEPANVHAARPEFVALEQLQQEGPVGTPTLDGDRALGQRPLQPSDGFLARVTDGGHLGEHRPELRRDQVALLHSRVHAQAGPGGQAKQLHLAGGRRESGPHVLGVQPDFNRVPRRRGRAALETPAARHVERQLDQINPGRVLRHGVLHLQARIDLHERELSGRRVEQELHGGGVLIVGRAAQPEGCILECLLLAHHQRR